MIAALLLACSGGDTAWVTPEPGCADGEARLEMAPVGAPYGATDGLEVGYGWPPQGGAPFAPFIVRLSGLVVDDRVEMSVDVVDDATGEVIGYGSAPMGLVCANVGDDEGWYVSAELHALFWGIELDALDGRQVQVRVEADVPEVGPVAADALGVLRPM